MGPRETNRESNAARVGFVFTQLDIALTYCKLARTRKTNRWSLIHSARKAYNNVVENMIRLRLTNEEFNALTADTELLKLSLEALEEQIPAD